MTNESSPRHSPFLIGTAVFAFLWTVARAAVQSVTIDEADTYLAWASPAWASHWTPHSNNHVLNSMLMRLVTSIFGASPLSLRTPALIGAVLYIAAAYCLVRLIATRRLLQWALFVCLVYSPFVMDYLVAARGYGMASAFLLWMLVIAARHQALDPAARAVELVRTCALISIGAGLCVCANFSFAIADGLTALGLFLWICRDYRRGNRREYLKILAAFTLPGLAVAYFIVGSVVLSWPKGQFTWGADSLLKTVGSVLSASLFEPNDYLLNPRLHHYLVHLGRLLYPILAAVVLWHAAMLAVEKRRSPLSLHPLTTICGAALLAALACHAFLFLAFGILLPLDRTAMWVLLLFLTVAGTLAAALHTSAAGRISGTALTVILVSIAGYNIGCLRLTYFKEWKYDADMKHVYAILSNYNHTYNVTPRLG